MGKIFAAVGTALALGLAVFKWYTSPKRQLEREFKDDEAERNRFLRDVDIGDLRAARKRWLRKVRNNRLARRD